MNKNPRANRADIIAAVAAATGLTKQDADAAITATLNAVARTVAEGTDVSFTGFGTFRHVVMAERETRNPQTGERMTAAGGPTMRFTTSPKLTRQIRNDQPITIFKRSAR